MNTSTDEILRPKTPEEAGALLEKLGDRAGLLWWGARVEIPAAWSRPTMIDLSDLDLRGIQLREGWLAIGGLTRLQDLVESSELQSRFGGIVHAAARRMAHYGMRNLATLGGALFSPGGPPELSLALLVVGGEVVFAGETEKVAKLETVLTAPAGTVRGLVKEVRLPVVPETGTGWGLEWVARSPMDMAIAAAAAMVSQSSGHVAEVRLAVGSLGLAPRRIELGEAALAGQPLKSLDLSAVTSAVKAAVAPEADFRATAEYQREMMAQLAARAVASALEKAGAE